MAHPTVRRIPPPRTLVIDTPADLQAFRQVLVRRWRLPHVRITLRIGTLPSARADTHERQLNRLLRSNPLAAAGLTALVMAVLALASPLPPAGTGTWLALGAWVGEVFLAAVLGWLAGTALHRLATRWRLARLCTEIEAETSR